MVRKRKPSGRSPDQSGTIDTPSPLPTNAAIASRSRVMALHLLDRELRNAAGLWNVFSATRAEEDWQAYRAAYRRASMVVANTGVDYQMPKPVLRVKASGTSDAA